MGDDGVADIQLIDAPDRGDGLGVVVMQTMAGIDDQAVTQAGLDTIANARELAGPLGNAVGIGIATRVQFDGRRTDPGRRLDLQRIGIDEQRDFRAAAAQTLHRLTDARLLTGDVQPTLRG